MCPHHGPPSSCQGPEATVSTDTTTEDDRRINGWLMIWAEATVTQQWDTAVEAAEELDRLLRVDVTL